MAVRETDPPATERSSPTDAERASLARVRVEALVRRVTSGERAYGRRRRGRT